MKYHTFAHGVKDYTLSPYWRHVGNIKKFGKSISSEYAKKINNYWRLEVSLSVVNVNIGFILAILLLPFFIFFIRHPNRVIRRCSKILFLVLVIIAIIIIPLVGIFQFGIKIFFIPLVPLVSRGATWILERTNILNTDYMRIVEKLLMLSAASVGLGLFAMAYEQPLKPITATIIVLAFILFVDIGKYIITGYLFGIVSAVFMISQSPDAIYTVVFIFIVVMLIVRFFDRMFSFSDTVRLRIESSATIIIILASYPLIITGGLKFYFEDFFIQIVVFTGLLFIYIGTSFLINKIPVRIPVTLQHFIPIGISLVLVFTILVSVKNSNIANNFGLIFYFLIFIFLGLTFLRILSPLDKLFNVTSFLNSINMLESLQFYFGNKFGKILFVFLYGKSAELIKPIYSFIMLGLYIVGGYLIFKQLSPEVINFDSNNNGHFFYTVLSACFSYSFVYSVSKTIDSQKLSVGMSNEDAIKFSTAIVINYFFILIPLLLFAHKQFQEIGLVGIILGIIFILLIILNTNITLCLDFSKPQYNDFAITREYLSFAILVIPHIVLVGAFYYFFEVSNPLESIKRIIEVFILVSLISVIIARAMSYDNFLGSKKFRKISLFILIFLIIGVEPIARFNAIFFLLMGFSQELAMQFTYYINISILMDIITLIVIVLLQSSNDKYKDDILTLLRKRKNKFRDYKSK